MSRYALLAVLALAACGKKSAPEAAAEEEKYNPVSEQNTPDGLVLQSIDLDLDRDPDLYNYYLPRPDGSRGLTKKELDVNLDGKIDTRTLYDDEGRVSVEEYDRDLDGKFDSVDRYREGLRAKTEADTNGDGKMDTFSYYAIEEQVSRIERKERDTDGNALIDFWEKYDDKGIVIRTGRDIDGDGKMDIRDE